MSERALNPLLAVELGAMMPGWEVTAESTSVLTDAGRAPDMIVETVSVSERRIAALADAFERGVSQSAANLRSHLLRVSGQATLDRIAGALHLRDSEQTSVIAAAVVANALVFQSAVSAPLGTPTIEELRNPGGAVAVADVLATWREILATNYWPIFAVASDVLRPIGEPAGQALLNRLSHVVAEMSAGGVLAAGDLAGQMFGRLITDRKFLATFYTLPASAALLAELAVSRLDPQVSWADAAAVARLRVADFACGTGMLLSAAYRRISSRVGRTGRIGQLDQARLMHSAFMEEVLVGCDIMPAAVHLTASILSAAHPSSPFGNTNIHLMPYGYPNGDKTTGAAIGSLELLGDERVRSLFGTGRVRAGGSGDHADSTHADASFAIDDASVDLVIQNPPFTRPNGPEADKLDVPIPSFAGFDTSADEQEAMALRLRQIYLGTSGAAGHGNAGLASNFIDLAHTKVRPGGVVALVLPATFASGDAWSAARGLLARKYRDITVVTLAASSVDDRAFSADTGMAEALVVATRREAEAAGADGTGDQPDESAAWVNWVTLWRRPENPVEAVAAARAVVAGPAGAGARAGDGGAFAFLNVGGAGGRQIGCRVSAPLSEGGCAHVTEPLVAAAASGLRSGVMRLPRLEPVAIPTVRLDILGSAGPQNRVFDDRRIRTDADGSPRLDEHGRVVRNGVFDIWREIGDPEACEYPALWGHSVASGRERCLVVAPDRDLRPWPGHERRARELWPGATRLHYNRDFRLNSQSLSACITPSAALVGVPGRRSSWIGPTMSTRWPCGPIRRSA